MTSMKVRAGLGYTLLRQGSVQCRGSVQYCLSPRNRLVLARSPQGDAAIAAEVGAWSRRLLRCARNDAPFLSQLCIASARPVAVRPAIDDILRAGDCGARSDDGS